MSWFSKLGSNINAGIQTAAKWVGNLGATIMDPITHNSENLKMQKDELDYQHNLQNTIFEREDTAQQRAAADLASAGLSKTLAAGSGAGVGSVVSTKAPQRESDVGSLLTMAQISQQMANISHTKAETERLSNQNTLDKMDIDYFKKRNMAPAEQNKYTQLGEALVTGFEQLQGLWHGDDNGASTVMNALNEGMEKVGGVAKDAVAPVIRAAKRMQDYLKPSENLVPQPDDFVNYSDYAHQVTLAGYVPASEGVFRFVKKQNAKGDSTYHVSSTGAARGGRNGSL